MADTDTALDQLTKAADAVDEALETRRKQALAALESGATIRAVAAAARVAVNTLLKWRAENK
jgi:hypothetical protein